MVVFFPCGVSDQGTLASFALHRYVEEKGISSGNRYVKLEFFDHISEVFRRRKYITTPTFFGVSLSFILGNSATS